MTRDEHVLLHALRDLIREELAGRGAERLTASYTEAALMLGRSPRTIARMVQRGEVFCVTVAGSRMIPTSELRRIATPAPSRARKGGAPRSIKLSAQQESVKALEDLKRR